MRLIQRSAFRAIMLLAKGESGVGSRSILRQILLSAGFLLPGAFAAAVACARRAPSRLPAPCSAYRLPTHPTTFFSRLSRCWSRVYVRCVRRSCRSFRGPFLMPTHYCRPTAVREYPSNSPCCIGRVGRRRA